MKQFKLFLVIIVLADFTFALPVTKVEEKKDESEEKHEPIGDDIEVKKKYINFVRFFENHSSYANCVKFCP